MINVARELLEGDDDQEIKLDTIREAFDSVGIVDEMTEGRYIESD